MTINFNRCHSHKGDDIRFFVPQGKKSTWLRHQRRHLAAAACGVGRKTTPSAGTMTASINDATSISFGTCRGDATASEQCRLHYSIEDFISLFLYFAFAQTKKYAAPPVTCSGGILWRCKSPQHANKKLWSKNNQPVWWWHRSTTQQVICVTCMACWPPRHAHKEL